MRSDEPLKYNNPGDLKVKEGIMINVRQSLIATTVLFTLSAVIAAFTPPSTREGIVEKLRSGVSSLLVSNTTRMPAAESYVSNWDSFHFLQPLAPNSGNPQAFDATLLNYLSVEICEVSGSGCQIVKTFTAQGQGSERIRVTSKPGYGSFYIVNWDTGQTSLDDKTYRVRVMAADIQLGSIDLPPDVYNTFGRTWPIKFLIEKDPALRVRVMRSAGRSCSQAASVLKNEYGLSAEETASVLANDAIPCSQAEIDLAIRGVYQAAVIPETTKVADEPTRNAQSIYDPVTGRMDFSTSTSLLNSLRRGDVLVSEPSAAAPNGYLRKVTAIKNGGRSLETTQASFNDALQQGFLDAAAALRPGDLLRTEAALPGVTFRTLSRAEEGLRFSNVVGEDYDFETSVDITLDRSISGGGVNGDGHVRIQGYIRFNAGYDVGFGVEPCLRVPPVCVDRVEARVGIDHYSNLRVSGEFNGTMQKEIKLSTHYFKPIVFFIGPIPVVLVPIIDVVVGANGEAHLRFSFAAELSAQLLLGAKWTEENGWENLSRKNGVQAGIIEQNLDANMKLRAYGKAGGKLLFYGVAGPGIASSVGGGADVQVPRRPWWRIFGYIGANVNFQVDLGGILKLNEFSATVLDEEFTLLDAPNAPPRFSNVNTGVIQADIATSITLGPRSGFFGHFDVMDPEGDIPILSAVSNVGVDNPMNLTHSFQTGGQRIITITATDNAGASSSIMLTVNVNNSLPIVTISAAGNTVPATVQYFVSARAFDFETGGNLGCDRLHWRATLGTLTILDSAGDCNRVVVFPQPGQGTITVTATDPHGGVGSSSRLVTVTAAPANLYPIIDLGSVSVRAVPSDAVRPPASVCPIFSTTCRVPDGAVLFNGQSGDWFPPLLMSLVATDPEGSPVTVQWSCRTGTQEAAITDLGGGVYSCNPIYATGSGGSPLPIIISVVVSDGVNQVRQDLRTYLMNQLVN